MTRATSIGVGVGVYGISFGVLAVAAGLSAAQACAMSALMFTGASQFAFVGVIAAGGGVGAAFTPAVMLALRNGAYALSLNSILPRRLHRRAVAAQFVIDETTAMARAEDDPALARSAFLATAISVWVFWTSGTLLGALVGHGIGDPRSLGLDAMFPAAFLALLAPQLRRPGAPVGAIVGGVAAVVLVPFIPTGLPIIASIVGVIPAVVAARKVTA